MEGLISKFMNGKTMLVVSITSAPERTMTAYSTNPTMIIKRMIATIYFGVLQRNLKRLFDWVNLLAFFMALSFSTKLTNINFVMLPIGKHNSP